MCIFGVSKNSLEDPGDVEKRRKQTRGVFWFPWVTCCCSEPMKEPASIASIAVWIFNNNNDDGNNYNNNHHHHHYNDNNANDNDDNNNNSTNNSNNNNEKGPSLLENTTIISVQLPAGNLLIFRKRRPTVGNTKVRVM